MADAKVTILVELRDQLSKRLASLRGAFTSLAGMAVKAFAGAATGAVAAFTATLLKATQAAAGFQQVMDQVNTIISDDMAPAFANAEQRVLDMSKSLPQSAEELGVGLYDILSSGVEDAAGAFEVLEVSAKAAIAGGFGTTTQDAVRTITALLNAYQLEATEAGRISDILFETVRVGVITFPELAQNIGNLATSAALAGVTLEEVGAAIATMTKFGVNAAETTTSLNRLFLSLANQTKQQEEALKAMGIEFTVAAVKSKGLAAVLSEIEEKTGGNIEALSDLFPSIRELRAAMVIAGEKGGKVFSEILGDMEQNVGATDRAFNKVIGSLANVWKLFKNNLNVVLIEFGTQLIPGITAGLREAIGVLSGFATGIDDNAKGLRTLGERIGDLFARIVRSVPDVIDATANVIDAIKKGIDFLRNFVTGTGLTFGIVGFVLFGPQGAAGLTVLGTLLDKIIAKLTGPATEKGVHEELIKRATEEVNRLERGVGELNDRFKAGQTDIKQLQRDLQKELGILAKAGVLATKEERERFGVLQDTLKLVRELAAENVVTVDESVFASLTDRWETLMRTIVLNMGSLQDMPKGFFDGFTDGLREFADSLREGMAKAAAGGTKATTRAAVDELDKFIANTQGRLKEEPFLVKLAPEVQPAITPEVGEVPVAFSVRQIDLTGAEQAFARLEELAALRADEILSGFANAFGAFDPTIAIDVEEETAHNLDVLREAAERAGLALSALDGMSVEVALETLRSKEFQNTLEDVQAVAASTGASLGDLIDSGITDFGTALAAAADAEGLDGVFDSTERLEFAFRGVTTGAEALAGGFGDAFEAMVTGSENAAAAFAGAMLSAIAQVAQAQAAQFFAEGLFALGRGIFGDPRGFAAAAQMFVAAAAMSAVAGLAGGLAGGGRGGGGGGGGGGGEFEQRRLEGPEEAGTIVIEGDPVLDMSSAQRRRELAEALGELYGRRTVIRTAR